MTRTRRPPQGPGTTYMVGYGKPPKSGQFKPGKIGNPWGRRGKPKPLPSAIPPRVDNFEDVLEQERNRIVEYTEAGERRSAPVFQLVVRQAYKKAAEGNPAALREVVKDERERSRAAAEAMRLRHELVADYKLFCEEQFADNRRRGLPPPQFEVHPDDLFIDRYREVRWILPLDEETADLFDQVEREHARLERSISRAKSDLALFVKEGHSDRADRVRRRLSKDKARLRNLREFLIPEEVDPDLGQQVVEAHTRPGRRKVDLAPLEER